ncbi:MAG TPA: hypothetical protein VF039_15240, partial [Longimicrobiales bacterium]
MHQSRTTTRLLTLGLALTAAACATRSTTSPGAGAARPAADAAPTSARAAFDFPDDYRSAYVDDAGVIRWRDDDSEVRLFGVNYALPSSGDFRAAGYLTDDRYALVDQDFAHFARMGWNGLRVAFWGDWQNADIEGNLIENEHLDLVDYIIARARERGIYILFNPIHTYHAGWPDAMGDSFPGFAAHIEKSELGRDPAAIAAQVNYIRQILDHVNPYTGTRLADEPAILFVEMINEPAHHPRDTAQQIDYINALHQAVRDAGSDAITFHNVSQDFRIAPAIVGSDVQGASFGWYPTGLNSGRELRGNHLRSVEDYPPMRMPSLAGMPKLVYEFDSADQLTGTMYPAMAREFARHGVHLAAMFAYDMLLTSSRNLGWQTHVLNMVYTPRKAMSAVIAAEAMRRIPRGADFGEYPQQNEFGDFTIFPEQDLTVLNADDAFMYTGDTDVAPRSPSTLTRIAGAGSSPVVEYEGAGIYFLDRIAHGVWRLEVYPDAVPVDDPFEMPRADKIVTRAIYRSRDVTVRLPGLGDDFTVTVLRSTDPASSSWRHGGAGGGTLAVHAGRFGVMPGVYVLSADSSLALESMPDLVPGTHVRFDEFVAPAPDSWPLYAGLLDAPEQHVAGESLSIRARVVPTFGDPDSVTLWVAPGGRSWFRPFPMTPSDAYEWSATVPADVLGAGVHQMMLSVKQGDSTTTFPSRVPRAPTSWDFGRQEAWRISVVSPTTALALLDAGRDVGELAFSRIGDGWREGVFRVALAEPTGEAALHLELPMNVGGISPEDYTTSLFVGDRIASRGESIDHADAVRLRIRGIGDHQVVHVTLVEDDGTSWSAPVAVWGTEWRELVIPLERFRGARGVKLPQG